MKAALQAFILFMVLIVGAFAAGDTPAVVWQSSASERVQLGIRDKNDTLGSYEATFHVAGPENTKYTKTITVRYAHFGYVTFPDDFERNWAAPGIYIWFATVAGKKVISGKFELIANSKYYGVHIPFN
jgi:hypothetical protein